MPHHDGPDAETNRDQAGAPPRRRWGDVPMQTVISRLLASYAGAICLSLPPAVTGSWDAHTNVFSLGHLQTEFRTRSWTSEDGLPQNTINCLFQASDGYLWIGTRSGLARYDGRRFTLYDRRNTPALRSPDIQALAENPPGTLWIGTRHGLARRVNHVFMDVPLPDSDGFVRSICPRRAGGVWLGTGAGPMWVEGDAVFAYTNYPPFHPSWDATARILDVDAVLEDTAGDLWLRDPRGLVRLRAGQTEFEIMAAYKNDEIRLYNGAGLLADRGGAIWFGWGVGLCRWQEGRIESWPRNPDPQAGNGLRGEPGPLAWGWDGALWFGDSWGGLSRWQDGRFIHFRPPSGLSDELVASLLSDREGTLWVGTKNGGLNRLQRRRFVNLTTVDGLADNAVWSIAEGPDGSVWMATDRGLSRYRDGVFRTFHLSQPDPFTSNDWNHFTVVLAAPSGQVWAGSWAGLCQVRSDTVEQFRVRVGDTNHPVPAGTIAADRSGGLWVGGPDLFRLKDGQREAFVPWCTNPPPDARAVLSDADVVGVLEDPTGAIWVGTKAGGVNRLRGAQCDGFTPTSGFPAAYAAAALADPDGTVWFASDRGLIRGRHDRFFLFTTEHGLSENLVLNVLEDDAGWLWLNGHRGLQRVRKQGLNAVADGQTNRVECLHFGEADGMLSAEGNGGRLPNSCRTRDGRLWFPTTKGVVIVDPRALAINDSPPPVVLEQVVADGQIIYGEDCRADLQPAGAAALLARGPAAAKPGASPTGGQAAPFHLPPGRARSLIFHYTANSFVAPEHVRFRYQLEGHDADWQEDNTNLRTAFYTDLRPGTYRFRVRAFNNHGVPSERDAEFAFSLAPHFYQTWPFYLLCATAVLAAGGSLHGLRIKGLRRIQELERQHALDLERARIARDMHDGLGADLTKIAMLADLAQRRAAGADPGPLPFEKVSTLARGLVDGISELVWVINPRNDTLDSLAAYLREQAAELLEPTALRYRFDFPREIPARPVPGLVRRHLFLCAKEALHNVLKHAHASELTCGFAVAEDRVQITVVDNGRGFAVAEASPDASQPTSLGNGLRHLRERIAGIGGECRIESAPGEGTRVILSAPLGEGAGRG